MRVSGQRPTSVSWDLPPDFPKSMWSAKCIPLAPYLRCSKLDPPKQLMLHPY